MKNIIGKGIAEKYYYVFSWGFSFFSAGYLLYKKINIPVSDEFNKLSVNVYRNLLYTG